MNVGPQSGKGHRGGGGGGGGGGDTAVTPWDMSRLFLSHLGLCSMREWDMMDINTGEKEMRNEE